MLHSGKHDPFPVFLRHVAAVKFKMTFTFSQLKHLICFLCSIVNKTSIFGMGAAEPVDVFAKTRNRSNWREAMQAGRQHPTPH